MTIKKAAVIGAGVMGAGIAAQLANAGIEVELLDRVDPKNADRTSIAKGALDKLLKDKTNPLMHPRNVKKIRAGNMEDDAARLGECDIIIEAVFEDPQVKHDIFKKIDANRKPGAIIASNTSTIPLHDLLKDQTDAFKKDFMITHFFNPPRYLRLLELVTSEFNTPEQIAEVARFMDEKMGKGVVHCHDTPGFIGNRIGTFWIQCGINETISRHITIEEADAVLSKPMGVPKTGIFGLVDLVGLDLMPHISKSLLSKLPADDGYVKANKDYPVINNMIATGYTGRKGKGGFYRINDKKEKFAVDLDTGAERPAVKKVKLAAVDNAKKAKKNSLKAVTETKDKYGDLAWSVFKQTMIYSLEHAHEIADNITLVDDAMKLGYSWKKGPFEMIDDIGVDYFIARLKKDGDKIPDLLQKAAGKSFYRVDGGKLQFMQKDGSYANVARPEGVLLLEDIKRASKPLAKSPKIPGIGQVGAQLWDIGDGVICVEFISKMNSLDYWTMTMINEACDMIEKSNGKYKALVVYNEGDNFSVGANLGLALYAAKFKQLWLIDKMVEAGQETYKRLKYAPFPVVSAPTGFAFGGGCEILLHSSHVQAHAETYTGLVEVGVGLLPAWGGSTELLTRAKNNKKLPNGPMPPVANVFETISTAKVSTSAQMAQDIGYLRKTDGITMNKSRLLQDAKTKALELAQNYTPEKPFDMQLPGPGGKAALDIAVDGFYLKGAATTYDVVVSDKVADVLTGGDKAGPNITLTQDYLRALERKHFMELLHDERTIKRIETMLKTNKPLREKPDATKTAAGLRKEAHDATKPGWIARIFSKNARKKKPGNDNDPKKDPKAQVNWPKLK